MKCSCEAADQGAPPSRQLVGELFAVEDERERVPELVMPPEPPTDADIGARAGMG
jgi:hypothetical protein